MSKTISVTTICCQFALQCSTLCVRAQSQTWCNWLYMLLYWSLSCGDLCSLRHRQSPRPMLQLTGPQAVPWAVLMAGCAALLAVSWRCLGVEVTGFTVPYGAA